MPQFPGFVGPSYAPLSYRADRERTVNLYAELIESKHGPNTAWLRRRPALVNFAGLVTEAGITSSVNYLLVGGGGGAGGVGLLAGGGGAGALVQGSVALTVASYPVVVGTAGAVGANGTSSTWRSLTAAGGGHGGNDDATPANGGANGASGGGAATSYFDGTTWTPFTGGIGSQGFNGGNSDLNAGAGGGGSNGAGQSATQNNGGAGGNGTSSSITGSAVVYAAGGAGVGLTTRGAIPAGASYGSGGSASSLDPGHSPVGDQVAAQGGIVVLSYRTGTYTATGGTITTVGDYTVHTFTADGTFDVTAVIATSSTTAGGGSIHYCPAQGRAFVISTSGTLYEIFSDGSLTNYGSVVVGAFRPTMTDNGTFNQLLIVSGYAVYIFDLSTNTLSTITTGVISDPVICRFSDGYFLLLNNAGVLQWSAPGDGTTWDALDIAKNSATADPWVSLLVVHRELWLLGAQSGQIWVDTGNTDQPFEMAPGSVMHQGVIAPFTLQRCDNSSFWVGQNDQGRCVVFRANGYTPTRVSNHAVELSLGTSTDLENAIACTFQAQGHTFYQIYVPDIETSWVYDVSTDLWFEWAQLVDDSVDPWTWAPWPVQMATFAFGKNLVVGPETALVGQLAWDDSALEVLPVNTLMFSVAYS